MTGSNNLNLKYQISDCKDIMFVKFEFVAMTPFHCKEKVKKKIQKWFLEKSTNIDFIFKHGTFCTSNFYK